MDKTLIYTETNSTTVELEYQPLNPKESSKRRGFLHIRIRFLFGIMSVEVPVNLWDGNKLGINSQDGKYCKRITIDGKHQDVNQWWSNKDFRWFIIKVIQTKMMPFPNEHQTIRDFMMNSRPEVKSNTNTSSVPTDSTPDIVSPEPVNQGAANAMNGQEELDFEKEPVA